MKLATWIENYMFFMHFLDFFDETKFSVAIANEAV